MNATVSCGIDKYTDYTFTTQNCLDHETSKKDIYHVAVSDNSDSTGALEMDSRDWTFTMISCRLYLGG